MTDATVTQLHHASPAKGEAPRRKSKDVTGPLRSRRARQKRKTATKTIEAGTSHLYEKPNVIKADDTALARWVPWSVWPLAGTTVGLMAVSLTHLSDGVTQLTAIPSWQAWAMAVGIDCMLISVAMAQLTAPAHVKRDIAIVARCMEAGTLVMSAGLNALAFTGGAFDAAHWAQVAFGCFVPAAISGPRISWLGLHGADAGLSPWGEILCDLVTRAVWPVVGPPRFFTRRRLGLDDCFQQCWQPAPPLGLKCMGDLRCMPSILKFGCDPDHYPRSHRRIAINLVDGILNSAEPSPSWWPRLAPRRCQAGRLWRRACRLSR